MATNDFQMLLKGKTALITGASSGIGMELATVFAKQKENLVLVARNAAKLEEMPKEFQAMLYCFLQ